MRTSRLSPLVARVGMGGAIAAGVLWALPFRLDESLGSRRNIATDLLTLSGILGSGVALVAALLPALGPSARLDVNDRRQLRSAILWSFVLATGSGIVSLLFNSLSSHYEPSALDVPLVVDLWIFLSAWSWVASTIFVFSVLSISLRKWVGSAA